jgi:hypothetical protein
MLIAGEWLICDDGMPRPGVRAKAEATDGSFVVEFFLIDSGADRTVFSVDLLARLGFPGNPSSGGLTLQGVGGASGFVLVQTALEFTRDDGVPVHVRGEFAAFTDPTATDLSILGRDVLNNFDVVLSRPRNEILLLAPNHFYRIDRV